MKYKTIVSIYQQEEQQKTNAFKDVIFKLFQISNESRETTSFIGHLLTTLCFLQIASLIKFHLPNEEIDEFQKNFNIISLVLNYTLYFYKQNIAIGSFSTLEYIVYSIFIVLMITLIIAIIIIYTNYASSNSILFTAMQYFLQFIQWVGIIPSLVILGQVEFTLDNIAKCIIHSIIILIFFTIGLTVAYFNLISSTIPTDFFNSNDNCIPLDIFALQILAVIISLIIYQSATYLFMAYIVIFLFLIKMTYDGIRRFLFYGRDLAICLNVLTCLLYERLLDSVIVKYTYKQFGQAYHSYYVPLILVISILYYIITKFALRHISNYSLEHDVSEIKSVSSFVRFAESLLFVIKDPNSITKTKKVGYIIDHLNICDNLSCPLKKEELYLPKYCIFMNEKAQIYNDQVREAHLVMELYRTFYKAFRFDFDFILSLLKFMLFFIGNYEQLLIEIETATKYLNLSLYQEYILFIFKSYANNFIVNISENEVSKNVSSGQAYWSVLMMLNVLTYDKIIRQMGHYIYLCLEKKRQLWKLIENEDIIIEELFEIGNEFFTYKTNLNKMWEQLNLISGNNPDSEITNLYCDYLANICEDIIESELIIEKVKPSLPQTADEIFNNKFKSETGVIIIQGNKEISIGRITYINESLIKMLGYNSREELLGNNINDIIPGTIGKHHETLLVNYFEKGYSNILKKTLNLCLKSKKKFLIPVHLLVTFIPNFKGEIEGIGLIRHKTITRETIICSEDGTVEGATLLISQLLNITPNFIEKDQYFIQGFFPQLMRPDRNGIPKLFSKEFKTLGKKNEFKVELLIPEENQIDSHKITIKTKKNKNTLKIGKEVKEETKNEKKNKTYLTFGIKSSPQNNHNNNPRHSIGSQDNSIIKSLTKNDKETNLNNSIGKFNNLVHTGEHNNNYPSHLFNHRSLNYGNDISNNNGIRNTKLKKKKTLDSLQLNYLSPFPSLLNERRGSRSFTSNNSEILFPSQTIIPLSKKTPEIDQILSYQKDFKTKASKNLTSSILINKLDNIYESMISLHSNNTYNQNVEISITHVSMKILNNYLHIITIPSESLFDIKKENDNYLSEFSNAGLDNMRMPPNSKEKMEAKALVDNIREGSHVSRLDQFEVDSLSSGRDTNFLLEKHLKEMKRQTKDRYNTDKIIGVLMSLIMIIIVFTIILITNDMFTFVKKYIILNSKTLTIQYSLVDISKYSCLIIVKNKFIEDLSGLIYYKDYKKMLINTTELVLSEIEPFLITFRDIYGYEFVTNVYIKPISFSFRNYKVEIAYINGLYYMVANSIIMNKYSLLSNIENFMSVATQNWTVMLKHFNSKYNEKTNLLFCILCSMIIVGLVLIFILLLILFLSYKKKKKEQIKILSAYEKFVTEDVNYLLNKIELFERRYIDLFKHNPEFKKKKVKFDTKNSNLLNRNNQQRLIKKQEAQKSRYNILGTSDDPNELDDNGTKKELILRENMTLRYIISVILIFSFCLLYFICLFSLSLYYFNINYNYKEITLKLYSNKYLLNYESYKFNHLFLSNSDIINENKLSIESVNKSLNITHSLFNSFSSLVTTHSNLFDKNISQIMTGDLCSVITKLPSCKISEFSYTLKKGIRSFVSFYFKTLEEAYTYYINGFTSIQSLADIFTNDKVAIQRFIIEDIVDVYDEIFLQLESNLNSRLNYGLIIIIIVVIVLFALFLLSVVYKLKMFIESIKQEEILCNKLIGEIPIDIVKGNIELKKCLNDNFKQ